MLFQCALHEQRDCVLPCIEVRVGIDAAGHFQVINNDGGIRDSPAALLL